MPWYNNVFTELPEKGAQTAKFEPLPRIIRKPFDEDKFADSLKEYDMIFKDTFNQFSGIPSSKEEQIAFLNKQQSRAENPANLDKNQLPPEAMNLFKQYVVKDVVGAFQTVILNPLTYVWGGLKTTGGLFTQPAKISGGGGESKGQTQKRNRFNKRKTQKKSYSE